MDSTFLKWEGPFLYSRASPTGWRVRWCEGRAEEGTREPILTRWSLMQHPPPLYFAAQEDWGRKSIVTLALTILTSSQASWCTQLECSLLTCLSTHAHSAPSRKHRLTGSTSP